MTNIINIENINVIFVFVKIAVGLAIIFAIFKFIKWFLKRMKFDEKLVITLSSGVGLLKGNFTSVTITNIGNEKLWIEKICILFDNEFYIDIECNKCLEPKQQECFEKRYSKSIPQYACFKCVKKYFIFYDQKIYMIECGKKEKHKIIKLKQYNSCIKNKQKIRLSTYRMTITNKNKERNEIIFNENMIYLLQFVYKEDIESEWQFYCFATIDCNGNFMAYDKLLLQKNGKPFCAGSIENSILKYPDKIVDFIRNNWIDTNFNDISDINYTTTPEAMVLSGVAERV